MEINKQEWKDGLPYVGCECECYDGVCWEFCIFIGRVNDEDFVLPLNGEVDRMKAIDPSRRFRPLQTKDKEREEGISEMGRILGMAPTRHGAAERMYDEGYHNGPKMGEVVSFHDVERECCDGVNAVHMYSYLDKHFIITRKVKS